MRITRKERPSGTFIGLWRKRPPYVVKNRILVGTGKRWEWVEPSDDPKIWNALLKVAEGRKPEKFADQYGLLGYNHLVPLGIGVRSKYQGDPIHWFEAQARTVYEMTILVEYRNEAAKSGRARKELETYLRKFPRGPYARGREVHEYWISRGSQDPVQQAGRILEFFLNPNLEGTNRQLQLTEAGPRNVFTFSALVQTIYWQLTDQIAKCHVRWCRECKGVFVPKNPKGRFCSSRCKVKWHVRKFRASKKRSRTRKTRLQKKRRQS